MLADFADLCQSVNEEWRAGGLLIKAIMESEDLLDEFRHNATSLEPSCDVLIPLLGAANRSICLNVSELELELYAVKFTYYDDWAAPLLGYRLVYDEIYERANSIFSRKYFLGIVENAKHIIREFLPTLYIDVAYKLSLRNRQYKENAHVSSIQSDIEAFYTSDEIVVSTTDLPLSGDYGGIETNGIFNVDYRFLRKNHDLMLMTHEYMHILYKEMVGRNGNYNYLYLNRALSEGFAVFGELICNKSLLETTRGCSRDFADFSNWKSSRENYLESFLKEKPVEIAPYYYGFKIMDALYKIHGFEGVKQFLKYVSPVAASEVELDSISFLSALDYLLEAKDPKPMAKLVASKD